jgi:hypothetical protein
MRGLRSAALLFLLLCTQAHSSEPSREYWRLCAQADVVVLGTLSVPRDGKGAIAGEDNWAHIALHPARIMKGHLPSEAVVRYYLGKESGDVSKETLLALDGQSVVAFLVTSSEGSGRPAQYFAQSEHGAEAAQPALVKEVDTEIARQDDVLAHWGPDSGAKDFTTVKALIDRTTTRDGATEAFKNLEALGQDGVSAMIAQMDDHRDLGVQQIELVNPPNFWEGIRHYGPKEVVDALSAILNQITAEEFGFIENGGSDEERDHAVAGWRIYDDVLRNHPTALKPEPAPASPH